MRIHKAYRYRVYPTSVQQATLTHWQDALRFLWNLANEQRHMGLTRTDKRYPTAFDQIKQLTELRAELPWLAEVPRSLSAQLLVELDRAWQRCFKRIARRPRWKRKNVDLAPVCEPDPKKWRLRGIALHFPKLGRMRTVVHRPLQGTPKMCSMSCEAGQWFASIVCEIEMPDPAPRTAPVIAIDRGITKLLADSDGHFAENPRFYELGMKRLARAQRVVSRRKKGSNNREKAKYRVARLHQKVRRQRQHVLHVESARYTKNHGVVVIEKLNVQGMILSRLSRSIADVGWSTFANMLRYKLAWSGGTLVEVSAHYSSQTCSKCGCVDAASRSGKHFCCTSCGHVDHADLNAAKILKQRFEAPGNPWCPPVEGSVPEAARRSRKAKVALRVPRRAPLQSSGL